MLTQQLLNQLDFLSKLQFQTFQKVVNYCINFIINEENTVKINEFIEIEEKEGDKITDITLSLIQNLVRYRTNTNDIKADVKLLGLDKEKKDYLEERVKNNLDELRKFIYKEELQKLTNIRNVEWRLEVQIASKTYKNDFQPNVLLNFQIEQGEKLHNNYVNSSFANLQNLHSKLTNAIKMHRSNKFKAARNSSV